MKPILSIITVFLTTWVLSQSPVLPLNTQIQNITHNAYLKDTENQFPPFIGTWVYQQGNTKVTIKFKKMMYHKGGLGLNYYVDRLVANYKVEKNGNVIFNPGCRFFLKKS